MKTKHYLSQKFLVGLPSILFLLFLWSGVHAQEINILGGGVIILSGDTSPDISDDTDFGVHDFCTPTTITRTFTIQNTGFSDLNLTGNPIVSISGSSDFTVSTQPSSSTVAIGGSDTFELTYTPTSPGVQSAVISIANNDADENPYTFNVQADAGGSTVLDTEIQKLLASDAAANNNFGQSVSISGNTAIVGTHRDDEGGINSGSAYIYELIAGVWTQTAKLTASDAMVDDYFGHSVSISGNTAIVGTGDFNFGSHARAAYVFEKPTGGWISMTETAKLTASDLVSDDSFGEAVSISGNTVIIGAMFDDDAAYQSGSAYIFEKPAGGWVSTTETAKLTASDANTSASFGISVSISGNTAVVGADGDGGAHSGAAYIFEKPAGGWISMTETAKLTASDAMAGDYFGTAVSISGNTAIAGALGDDDAGEHSGSAYVFEKPTGGWVTMTETAKLTSSDANAADWFGRSVSISSNTVIIGASYDDDAGMHSGSAYVFEKPTSGWGTMTETAKLTASDAMAGDWFGYSVSISENAAIVGALQNDDAGIHSGSAYIFSGTIPEILISGAGTEILDGDTTPGTTDDTAFGDVSTGSSHTHTFTIENTGSGSLSVTSVTSSNTTDFSLSSITLPVSVAGGGSINFEVIFSPSSEGLKTSTITVNNDDCNELVYDFRVQGQGVPPADPPVSITPPTTDCIYAKGQAYNEILVWWCDAAEDESGYEIWRKSEFETDFNKIAFVPGSDSEEITFLDNTDLEPDTKYTYWIVTVKGDYKSHPSDLAKDYTPPLAPAVTILREACMAGSAELMAEGTHRSADFRWYESEEGGEFLSEEALFETEMLTGEKIYWVTSMGQKYESTPRMPVTLIPNSLPVASVIGEAEQYSCESSISLSAEVVEEAIYRWRRFGIIVEETTEPTVEVSQQGTYVLEVVNASGCKVRSEGVKVFLNAAPEAKIYQGSNPVFCESGVLQAKLVEGASYEWQKDGVVIGSGESLTAEESGAYTLFVTRNGCTTETVSEVIINSLGEFGLTTDNAIICYGGSTELTVNFVADADYELLRNGRIEQRSITNTFTVTKPGAYTVRIRTDMCEEESEALFIERTEVLETVLREEGKYLIATDTEGGQDYTSVTWFLDNEEVPVFAGQTEIIPETNGVYHVEVTYESGCGSVSNSIRHFRSGITGTEEVVTEAEFTTVLYPNPASERVTLRLSSKLKEGASITLTDNLGRILEHRELVQNSIDSEITFNLERYTAGLYFIRLESPEASFIKKFVKVD